MKKNKLFAALLLTLVSLPVMSQEIGWPVNAVKLAEGQTIEIDGVVSAEEYAGAQAMIINQETLDIIDPYFPNYKHGGILDHAKGRDADTPLDDYNATYYFMWDDTYFYAAMDLIDDFYYYTGGDPNGADAMQFVFAESPDITATAEMFIPTLAPEDNDLYPLFKNAFGGWIDSIDLEELSEYAGHTEEPDAGNSQVEIRIPWEAMKGGFSNEVFPPAAGDMIGFQVLTIDFDEGALQWFGTNHTSFPWNSQGIERIFFIESDTPVSDWQIFD